MNSFTRTLVPALAATAALLGPLPAWAAWPSDPTIGGVQLTSTATDEDGPTIVSDGAGGMIVAWSIALTSTSYEIRAQRVNAEGVPVWPAGGRLIVASPKAPGSPVLVPDKIGGAILIWLDYRSNTPPNRFADIYAQRIDSNGLPSWSAGGVPVCTAPNVQSSIVAIPDDTNGAFIAWADRRSGIDSDIYAQHLLANGTSGFVTNGAVVCAASGDQSSPTIAFESGLATGSGVGFDVAWSDARNGPGSSNIFLQLMSETGTPIWSVDGELADVGYGVNIQPQIVSDGGGYVALTYVYYPGNVNGVAVTYQFGGAPEFHGVQKIATCGTCSDPKLVRLRVADAGGAYFMALWRDVPSNGAPGDLYAEGLTPLLAKSWPGNGKLVCTTPGDQVNAKLVSRPVNGAMAVWQDTRSGHSNIRAQLIDGFGNMRSGPDGLVVADADGDQTGLVAANNSGSEALCAWLGNVPGSRNIWTQRVDPDGRIGNAEPHITAVQDVMGDHGGHVNVRWTACALDTGATPEVSSYLVKHLDAEGWSQVGTVTATSQASYTFTATTPADSDATGPHRQAFQILAGGGSITTTDGSIFWFSAPDSGSSVDDLALLGVADPPDRLDFALGLPSPNPSRGSSQFTLRVARPGRFSVAILDAAGRRLSEQDLGVLGPGRQAFEVPLRDDTGRSLPSGQYYLRARGPDGTRTRSLVLTR